MASVHVQYDSGSGSESDSEIERDDYLGSDSNPESATLDGSTKEDEESAGDTTEQTSPTENGAQEKDAKSGIADAMAKILGKALPKNKNPILARGQTDREIQRKKRLREKENNDGVTKKKKKKTGDESCSSDETGESDDDSPEARKKAQLKLEQKREWENLNRVKPNVLDKDKERTLQKIATRGVVQLFNAVAQQQNIVGERLSEAGSSERRRDKALGTLNKKSFLDLLDNTKARSASSTKVKLEIKQEKEESEQPETWSILRDDFMMGARMKDWDKDSNDGDNENDAEGDCDNAMSDSD